MLSTSELLDQTKISSPRTLDHYRSLGLIPDPTIGPHKSGRGKTSYWSDEAPVRINTIRELLALGKSLEATQAMVRAVTAQSKNFLSGTRKPSIPQSKRPYKFAEASRQMDLEQALVDFVLAVEKQLWVDGAMFADPLLLSNGWHAYVTRDQAGEVLRLLDLGINPVLVFDGEFVRVVADFVAVARVAEMKAPKSALLIMPIGEELRGILKKVTSRAMAPPTVKLENKVLELSGGRLVERKGDWDFEVITKR
jgi:DNA-binding transcriptional MerR regulator